MIKIEITADDPIYRGHTKFKKGMTAYITKKTQKVTETMGDQLDEVSTYARFSAGMLGYEGREPVHCWVPNRLYKVVK